MRTRIVVAAGLLVLLSTVGPAASAAAATGSHPAGDLGPAPAQVPTTPPATTPPTTAPPTTAAPPTTSPAPTTTVPATTQPTRPSTSTSTGTSTSTSTTSTSTTTTTTTAAKPGSGLSGTTIALIVLAVVAALLVALLVALVLRRRGREQWQTEAKGAAAEASGLAGVVTQGLTSLDQPALAARTWSDVETRGARLHSRVRALADKPPDEQAGAVADGLDQRVQALRSAVDADRSLRVGPPAPTEDQLGYSAAVVRQRLADLEQSIGRLDDYLRQ